MTCNECLVDDPAPKKPMFVSSCPMAVDPRSTFSSSVTSNGADCQLDAPGSEKLWRKPPDWRKRGIWTMLEGGKQRYEA